MIGAFIIQIVLIAVNALFASSEIAVISMSEARLKILSEEGDKRAAWPACWAAPLRPKTSPTPSWT